MKITAAVPCYNGARTLGRVIKALLNQSLPPDEILIIDDGSIDESTEVASNYPIKIIRHDFNRGLAAARNTALKNALGDIIVFVDADAVPDKNLVKELVACYNNEEVVAAGGQAFETEAKTIFDRWRALFWRQTLGEELLENAWLVMGLCSSFRRSVLEKCNGFSKIFRNNGEDVDISLKLRERRWRLVYNPKAYVDHIRTDSFVSLLQLLFRHSYWQVLALKKNHQKYKHVIKRAFFWIIISIGSSIKSIRVLGWL